VRFDSAIRISPRMRAWMFSSLVSQAGFGPSGANTGSSSAEKTFIASTIGITSYCTPSRRAISRASSRLIWAVQGEGIITARTLSAPSASTATASVSAESMPPDKPMIAPGKPFLPT
jgi:hypothetical protein